YAGAMSDGKRQMSDHKLPTGSLTVKQAPRGERSGDSRFQRFRNSRDQPPADRHDMTLAIRHPASAICYLLSGIWNLESGIPLFPPLDLFPELADVPEDPGELVEGELGPDGAFDLGGLVHAVDDRRRLVLADREAARGEDGL